MSQDHSGGGARNETPPQTPTSEWIVAIVSLVLVVAALGYLVHDALSSTMLPPDVRVTADTVVDGLANHVVRFSARNLGGSTAASVQVTGELHDRADDRVIERSVATVRYIPASSTRRGGLFFAHDPRGYRLVVRAEGFSAP